MTRATGRNAAAVLASVSVAQAGFDIARRTPADAWGQLGGVLVTSTMIALVFALVVAPRQAGFLIAVLGIAATLVGTVMDFGPAGALAVLVIALPLVWLLGLGRGLFL